MRHTKSSQSKLTGFRPYRMRSVGGTTAVLALIFQRKLFVANVGDSRALLCRETREGNLSVEQVFKIVLIQSFNSVKPLPPTFYGQFEESQKYCL